MSRGEGEGAAPGSAHGHLVQMLPCVPTVNLPTYIGNSVRPPGLNQQAWKVVKTMNALLDASLGWEGH